MIGKIHPALYALFFFFLCSASFSQETGVSENSVLENAGFTEDAIFIINSFNFNITGFTRPFALIYRGELKTGEIIEGFSALEEYIADKTQILFNERVLERVSIDYTIGERMEDGKYPVDLVINVKDTWNIVAIPRPKYSSNTGFDLTLKARDYNFLGTMSPLRLDIGYEYDEEGHNTFLLMLDSNIPFLLFGLNWNLKFVNFFNYRPDTEQPFYYKNTTGLSVELPVKFTTVTIGFDEDFFVNEENSDENKPLYGNFQDGFYMSSVPYISWKIPTGLYAGNYGEVVYTPGLSARFYHEFPQWPLDEIRKGSVLTFKHNLGFNRVDWIGNFLKGFDVSVNNSFNFNFFNSGIDVSPWSSYLNVSGKGFFIITDFFGISSRFIYRHWFLHEYGYTNAGDVLRGIMDKDISADYMFSLNLDFPVRVLRFSPSVWFKKPKLRIFNFDLHLSPFVDTAFYQEHITTDNSDPAFLATGGMEIIVFPEFFRSLFLRVSLGFNLSDISNKNNIELFIGTDFHY